MLRRKRSMVVSVMLVWSFVAVQTTDAAGERSVEKGDPPKIQIAILLDTSGSMRGLIDQARTQLWKIVNEFSGVNRDGQRPMLEVALFEYGHDNLGAAAGFMRQVVPLSDELDGISDELFKLKVGGSKEYCGQAVQMAATELKWSTSHEDLKCIFIAGNEPFTQGSTDFREACRAAVKAGITVSTIYCGLHAEGVNGKWAEAATLADGSYMTIDQNKQVAAIPAPQDKQLAALSKQLNTTYVAYGTAQQQKEALQRQHNQDAHAALSCPSSAAVRAVVKCSSFYCNTSWDLCDASTGGKIKLAELKSDQLPEVMQKMTLDQRESYVEEKLKQRKQIQDQIKSLSEARNKFVAAELKKRAATANDTFDAAVVASVREQAAAKQFKVGK